MHSSVVTVPHKMVKLERMSVYRGSTVLASVSDIQWNLSITDTLGPEKQFVIQKFPLFKGYFICTIIYPDPQSSLL